MLFANRQKDDDYDDYEDDWFTHTLLFLTKCSY
jgi:hypothetical protein